MTRADSDKIKSAAAQRIVELASRYTKLKQKGANWCGPCPVHKGKDDNFMVSTRGKYAGKCHCWSQCGRSFTAVDLIMEIEGHDYLHALDRIVDLLNLKHLT